MSPNMFVAKTKSINLAKISDEITTILYQNVMFKISINLKNNEIQNLKTQNSIVYDNIHIMKRWKT